MLLRLQELWRWLSSPPREPIDDSPDWYGGLAVDPASFSKQLVNLQKSLTGPPPRNVSPQPVESAKVEFGSENAA